MGFHFWIIGDLRSRVKVLKTEKEISRFNCPKVGGINSILGNCIVIYVLLDLLVVLVGLLVVLAYHTYGVAYTSILYGFMLLMVV